MVTSSLTKGFLLLALSLSQQAAAACTRNVTAKQGDTCATLASATGITVTDFLKSNPAVTSCSALVVGGSYCVAGTADSAPTSSSAPPTSSSPSGLQVSTDGACGAGVTCSGSKFGNCCSAHGFCGGTDDYCSDGCQAGFGACGAGAGTSSVVTAPGGTVTVTVTAPATRTSVVYQTSVVTQTQAAGTAVVTQTVRITATVPVTTTSTAVVTQTIQKTATVPFTATSTTVLTQITTLTSLKTATTTQTVKLTSLQVDTVTTVLTSILTSTRIVTPAACNTTPTKTTGWLITTTQISGGRPTLPGTPSNCRYLDQIQYDDTCRSIANRNDLSLLDFYQLNPSVSATSLTLGGCTPELASLVLSGLCQVNCDALWEGYYVCVGR